MYSIILCYTEVPDAPLKVESKESTPTNLVLSVTPPDDDGGVPIIGYRVEFEKEAADYPLGITLYPIPYVIYNMYSMD